MYILIYSPDEWNRPLSQKDKLLFLLNMLERTYFAIYSQPHKGIETKLSLGSNIGTFYSAGQTPD